MVITNFGNNEHSHIWQEWHCQNLAENDQTDLKLPQLLAIWQLQEITM